MAKNSKKANSTVAVEETAKNAEEVKVDNTVEEVAVDKEVTTVKEKFEEVVDEKESENAEAIEGVNEISTEETIEDTLESFPGEEEIVEAQQEAKVETLMKEKEYRNPKLKHKVRYYEEVYGCNWNGQCFDY